MFRNAKILFCSGALQPRSTKDVIQNADTVVNPIVINPVVEPDPTKTETPLYSEIAKSLQTLTDNITEWFSGSGQQEKQEKQDKHDEDNKDVKKDL